MVSETRQAMIGGATSAGTILVLAIGLEHFADWTFVSTILLGYNLVLTTAVIVMTLSKSAYEAVLRSLHEEPDGDESDDEEAA